MGFRGALLPGSCLTGTRAVSRSWSTLHHDTPEPGGLGGVTAWPRSKAAQIQGPHSRGDGLRLDSLALHLASSVYCQACTFPGPTKKLLPWSGLSKSARI